MRLILVKEIVSIGITVSLFHFFALKLFLYWTTDWFDILMHFLGGALIGLIVISFIQRLHNGKEVLNKRLLSISVILAVVAIGLSWELWELFVGFTDVLSDRTDTIIDLIMDLIGGTSAIIYYYFKHTN